MGLTDNTYRVVKKTAQKMEKKVEGREQQVSELFTAAERLLCHTVAHKWVMGKGRKSPKAVVRRLTNGPVLLSGLAVRWNLMTDLASAIDRLMEKPVVEEEAPVVEIAVEEPAVEVFAPVEAPVVDENDEDEDDSLDGIDTSGLEFIDVMADPDRYRELLEMAARGEIRLVNRYRRSSRSRIIQSRDNVQAYYSILKNALLSYKGVKSRISWDYDSFNKGRVKVAKITAKTRTVYLYLAIDPATLQDTKYFFEDMSDKKKYAEVPVLMKIKGERKLKHALELIEKVCGEQLELPFVKDFVEEDYTEPYRDTAALVQEGLIKQYTAAIPVAFVNEVNE